MAFYEPGKPGKGKNEEVLTEEEKKANTRAEVVDFVRFLIIAVAVVVVLLNFVIINATIPSGSMENTIMTGDRIIGLRLAYIRKDPQRYDIVIFKYPDNEKNLFIKRIIGLPEETVVVSEGKVYVLPEGIRTDAIPDEDLLANPTMFEGTLLLDDSFCPEVPLGGGYYDGVFRVPEGHYFMMGDNRNHSNDSRFWENKYVAKDKILGKAMFRYWPLNKFKVFRYEGME